MKRSTETNPRPSLRLEPSDLEVLRKLKDKLGVRSASDLFRMGLRALAEKEGVQL